MPAPPLEVSGDTTRLDLPAIPSFAMPAPIDGIHSPFELLVVGDRLRGTRIQVGGYITWIYDCVTALARPGKTRAQIRRMIDDDPTSDPGPYIALCALYRRWQYRDEAIAVAELGSRQLPSSADLWFELGMGHDDRGDRDKAIEAFTRALEIKPDLAAARFQRGQTYFRKKDFAHARRDLEEFANAGGTSFEVQQAKAMLAEMKR